MPISGCHDLPLATFNLPPRNDQKFKTQPPPAATQKNAPQKARKIPLPAASDKRTLAFLTISNRMSA